MSFPTNRSCGSPVTDEFDHHVVAADCVLVQRRLRILTVENFTACSLRPASPVAGTAVALRQAGQRHRGAGRRAAGMVGPSRCGPKSVWTQVGSPARKAFRGPVEPECRHGRPLLRRNRWTGIP